jgi:hypothetical protein
MNRSIFIALFLCLFVTACQDDVTSENEVAEEYPEQQEEIPNELINCPENRPEVCTQIYQPVCGLVDTGIRCITTPCPSAEYKTFGNACTACSDVDVTGYVEGECADNDSEDDKENPPE